MSDVILNEDAVKQALIDAQGDLFIAAQLLGHVTVTRLDRAIRASDELQNTFLTIRQVKTLPEYEKASSAQIEAEVERRMALYRADGLEALHELATMDTTDNSAMASVKLAAAARLVGNVGQSAQTDDLHATLRELNEAYQQHAPRIKVTRTQTFEISRDERVIEGEATSTPSSPQLAG